ncbi:ketohydroxyglutarate aldolase [Macrococcus sp. EM39E]|uniref:ketohydroxyglutarate aldolase n=1 Tax=Macrococcus animalis TaxID=3395467 RepID=UPI0039BEA294
MLKHEVLKKIIDEKLMAIIRVETNERAEEIVSSCIAGGISTMEISYTNNNAGEVIKFLREKFEKKALIGAGTVLDSETARHAILNGAQFIIAPNFDIGVAKLCNRYQILYMPGCSSMTEIVVALENGADMIKAFPTSSMFGPKIVSTIKTPLPFVPVLSSGGANFDNIKEWLENGVDCIGIGSLLSKGDKDTILNNAKQLREIVNTNNH